MERHSVRQYYINGCNRRLTLDYSLGILSYPLILILKVLLNISGIKGVRELYCSNMSNMWFTPINTVNTCFLINYSMISFLHFTGIILQKKITCLYAITCVRKENAQTYVTTLLSVSFFIKLNTCIFLFQLWKYLDTCTQNDHIGSSGWPLTYHHQRDLTFHLSDDFFPIQITRFGL